MPHWSFLKATTGTGATATRAMISVTSCAYHLNLNADFEPPFDLPQASTLAWRFPTVAVCAAKVRLACPLTAQGPQDGPDQPRQHEGGSTKDILVIR